MRVSLGVALFVVLSGVALFGIGLARTDTYYIASGVPIFFVGTALGAMVLGKCVRSPDTNATAVAASSAITTVRPVLSANLILKKNKSDTDLELMGHMDVPSRI
jgi:hypothetical membrane protein